MSYRFFFFNLKENGAQPHLPASRQGASEASGGVRGRCGQHLPPVPVPGSRLSSAFTGRRPWARPALAFSPGKRGGGRSPTHTRAPEPSPSPSDPSPRAGVPPTQGFPGDLEGRFAGLETTRSIAGCAHHSKIKP